MIFNNRKGVVIVKLKHVIESQQFSREWLEQELFPLAQQMARIAEMGGSNGALAGKRMFAIFYESSTRTRASFETAMIMLDGIVAFSTENATQFSSAAKGETLLDTIRVLNRYHPHVIVLRHHMAGSAKAASEVSSAPIINAGDGTGQHPTQALVDIFTIFRRLNRVDNLAVTIVGDLAHGRTVRSLAYLLGKFNNIRISFIAPDSARVDNDIKEYLSRHNIIFTEGKDLRTVAPETDVIYQTRTQTERGSTIDRSDPSQGFLVVNRQILDLMKPDAIIMHPLPRNDEITTDVDSDSRAVYFTYQIDSGLHIRMALLKLLLT